MIEVPHEVLSEHFQQRIHGRRLVSAVFTTFRKFRTAIAAAARTAVRSS